MKIIQSHTYLYALVKYDFENIKKIIKYTVYFLLRTHYLK